MNEYVLGSLALSTGPPDGSLVPLSQNGNGFYRLGLSNGGVVGFDDGISEDHVRTVFGVLFD